MFCKDKQRYKSEAGQWVVKSQQNVNASIAKEA